MEASAEAMEAPPSNTPGHDPVSFIDDWQDDDTTYMEPSNSPGLVNKRILEAICSNYGKSSSENRGTGEPQPKKKQL